MSARGRRVARRTRRFTSVAVAAAFVATFVVLVASMGATAFEACGTCHRQTADSAEQDAHAGVACVGCHRRSGLSGVLAMRVRVASMVTGALLPGRGAPTPVDSGRCIACHEGLADGPVEANGLRMSHVEPLAQGMSCADCHGMTGHAEGGARAPTTYSMELCLGCHSLSRLSLDCPTCHVQNVSRSERVGQGTFSKTHGENWRSLHGMGDLRTCAGCHTAARCEGCHATAVPHAMSWFTEHGTDSLRPESKCDGCHSREFCNRCHVVPMPHPGDFRATHGIEATRVGESKCETCHDQELCERCHAGHTHPGLDPARSRALRRDAGLDD